MRICELKQREVINVKDCKRLGFVGDVDFDISTGKMLRSSYRDRAVSGAFWAGKRVHNSILRHLPDRG